MSSNASQVEEVVVTISIDTECDHDPRWIRSKPLSFDSIHEGLPNRLQPAFAEVGAIPTYLLTVEVLEDADCLNTLRNLPGEHELGTHLHAAFIEPQKKFFDYAGIDSPDFQSSYPPEIEFEKLKNLTELFETGLGYAPTSFRAGRYGASIDSIRSLRRLGYKVDTSVTPHLRWSEPNGKVDFRSASEQPYIPSDANICMADPNGDNRLLEVPVTVKPRLFRDPRWFRPWFATVPQMKDIFRYQLKRHRNKRVVYINMMFHSMEVIEKASPYPQTVEDVHKFVDDMKTTLQWCSEEGARFTSLSSLHDIFHAV